MSNNKLKGCTLNASGEPDMCLNITCVADLIKHIKEKKRRLDLLERIDQELNLNESSLFDFSNLTSKDNLPDSLMQEEQLDAKKREREKLGSVNLRADEETNQYEKEIKKIGKDRKWVFLNYTVDLWDIPPTQGEGNIVGVLRASSYARIIEIKDDDYKVLSPKKIEGWINKEHVKTISRKNPKTNKLCQ